MVSSRARPAPRTLLEALVRQRQWSHQDFCAAYAQAAHGLGRNLTVSSQHAGRWFAGTLKGLPYPAQCRVLEDLFAMPVTQLFGPALAGEQATGQVVVSERGLADQDEEISLAAEEAARFADYAEQSNVGPHTLEQFAADVRRIVTTYPNRPVYPMFVELRTLRNRAFEKLEGHQAPHQSRDLYLIAGLLSGVLANASFDLGRLDAAETQARTAFLCAELAGVNWLRAWIRGTQALIAYWDGRPLAAIRLAEDGRQYVPESGTAMIRLASIAARAHGMARDTRAVEDALAVADDARDHVAGDDDPGGMMCFPVAKQRFYASTARLWLGDPASLRHAETDAEYAVTAYEQDAPEHRRLGELNLARLDLATARLARQQIEASAASVRPVLEIARQRPIDSVTRRLRQVDAALADPRYAGSQPALDLREEIRVAVGVSPRPALPSRRQP